MKKLFLIWIFSGSLDGFSQSTAKACYKHQIAYVGNNCYKCEEEARPDTLRATLIVYYDRGPAILHTKPGFVVRKEFKDNVYLDDKKRVIKSPLEVLTYKLKK